MKLTQVPVNTQKASFKQLPKGVIQVATPIALGATLLNGADYCTSFTTC